MSKMKKNQRGFTIVELLIVVGVIGILAAVAVPSYQDYVIRSRVHEAHTVSQSVRTAVALYAGRYGTMPSALASLSYVSSAASNYSGNYVSTVNLSKVGSSSIVEVVFVDDPALGSAAAGNIQYTATINGALIQWSTGSTNIDEKYWPRVY